MKTLSFQIEQIERLANCQHNGQKQTDLKAGDDWMSERRGYTLPQRRGENVYIQRI